MKIDPARLIGPLVAVVLLVIIAQQTASALRASGVWDRGGARAPAGRPFASLERLSAAAEEPPQTSARRDPFSFERAPGRRTARRPTPPPEPEVVEPERPVLTAIIWSEGSPSATIRWKGRDYPVQVNSLFDEFRVLSISRDRLTLEHGGENLVLQLPEKGE
jgi:hypothetical protein